MIKENLIKIYERSFIDNWELPALTDYNTGEKLTYGDFARNIAKLHMLFDAIGVKQGDRIALIGKNIPNWVTTFMATITYGAVIVPILQEFNPADAQHIINHSEATMLFISKSIWENLEFDKMPRLRAVFQLEDMSLLAEQEGEVDLQEALHEEKENDLARPKLFIVNILLTLAIIAMLIWDEFPSYVPFMIGCALALFINYGFSAKMHKKIINLHAGPALMMCSTLMGAAILMGILTTSIGADGKAIAAKTMELPADAIPSVVRCLANIISSILPHALGQHLPLIIGILSVPLALAFDTDSYFYGMLPVMIGIGQAFGVNALPIAVAMVVCRNCATFISPMVPATLLGTGLAEVEIKDHIKASFLYVWVFSILCMIFAAIFGIMPL